jgi:hypothetical protein
VTQIVLVGIGAGLAAALMFVSPIGGTALAFPLFILCGLPVAIAGLGWSPLAAVVAAAVAGAALAFIGIEASAIFLLLFGAPVAWLVRLAMLSRAGAPDEPAGATQWFPLGRILLHAALAAAAGIILVGMIIGFDPDSLAADMAQTLADWLATAPELGPAPTPADIQPFVRLNIAVMPATVTAMLVVALVFNLWLAARIAAASGRLLRPRERLWTASLPASAVIGLVVAAVVAFVPGPIGYAAGAVAGALAAACALIGLAVIHALTVGTNLRVLVLVGTYVGLVFLGFPILLIALLGLAESFLHLRARRFGGAPPNV